MNNFYGIVCVLMLVQCPTTVLADDVNTSGITQISKGLVCDTLAESIKVAEMIESLTSGSFGNIEKAAQLVPGCGFIDKPFWVVIEHQMTYTGKMVDVSIGKFTFYEINKVQYGWTSFSQKKKRAVNI